MRHINPTFLNLIVGDTIEVKPNIYDREWTVATVERLTHTDIPIKHDPCTTMLRRHELFARINDRKDYCSLILREEDVRLNKI